MKRLLFLSFLFVTLFSGCDDKDYPPYEVKVNIEGEGSVIGDGTYSFGRECTLKAKTVENSDYKFTGWYNGDVLISRNPEITKVYNENMNLRAVFSDNVYSVKFYYIQKLQIEYFVIQGDEIYFSAYNLKDWEPLYPFRKWEAIDSKTGTKVWTSQKPDVKFIPEQNLMIFSDWDMN
jgi:hypothetical protein